MHQIYVWRYVNPFKPQFLLDSSIFEFGHIHVAKRVSVVNQEPNDNSVDIYETADYEPSYLDLHGLQKRISWYALLEG